MSFGGYAITLFDPLSDSKSSYQIPAIFNERYFEQKLRDKWQNSTLRKTERNTVQWSIPELESGSDSGGFSGGFNLGDRVLTFGLAPAETIISFVTWIRSIIAEEHPVYFLCVSQWKTIRIEKSTSGEAILQFAKRCY